jgi:hypothetical protein
MMRIQFQSLITRITLASIAAALGITLFLTGVWAGSAHGGDDRPATVQARGSFWSYDPETGNLTGPQGQQDFWNYDPQTGEKIASYSPGVAPEQLAALSSGRP